MGWGAAFVQVFRVLVQKLIFQMQKAWTMQYPYEGVSEEGEFFVVLLEGVF